MELKPNATKILLILFSAVISTDASSAETNLQPISESEAAVIVQAKEEAKELAKDRREAELLSADIVETAVADLGRKRVIFNRVEAPVIAEADPSGGDVSTGPHVSFEESDFFEAERKESINLTLSGTVYDETVSEVRWEVDGERFRIFTNANFLYFNGIGEFEDEAARYSIFNLIVGQSTNGRTPSDGWRPTLADFTAGALEYFIVEWGNGEEPDEADFKAIDSILTYYSEHHEAMRIRYENACKLRDARQAFLESNPPKVRDVIINYRPYEAK